MSAPSNENIALIAHILGFGYIEILKLDIVDFSEFVGISERIAKAKTF
nr:MAG TPA: hypothetical protein [Caudoviricetes sp.]